MILRGQMAGAGVPGQLQELEDCFASTDHVVYVAANERSEHNQGVLSATHRRDLTENLSSAGSAARFLPSNTRVPTHQ